MHSLDTHSLHYVQRKGFLKITYSNPSFKLDFHSPKVQLLPKMKVFNLFLCMFRYHWFASLWHIIKSHTILPFYIETFLNFTTVVIKPKVPAEQTQAYPWIPFCHFLRWWEGTLSSPDHAFFSAEGSPSPSNLSYSTHKGKPTLVVKSCRVLVLQHLQTKVNSFLFISVMDGNNSELTWYSLAGNQAEDTHR